MLSQHLCGMAFLFLPWLEGTGVVCAAAPGPETHRIIIVLDASGSMLGKVEGRVKMDVAKEAVAELARTIPSQVHVGLMAYGHRSKGDCGDIELVVAPGPGSMSRVLTTARALKPMGKTPISAAVKKAAEALRYTEDKSTVILISDGEETCDQDPCAVAGALEAQGIDFTAHVIGFDIGDPEADRQLRCLARGTGGQYFPARNAQGLTEALSGAVKQAVRPTPTPAPASKFRIEVRLAPGAPLESKFTADLLRSTSESLAGERVETFHGLDNPVLTTVAPGTHLLHVKLGAAEARVPLDWPTTGPVQVNLGAARLRPTVTLSADQADTKNLEWTVDQEFDGNNRTLRAPYEEKPEFILPAGPVRVTVKLGKATTSTEVTLKPGQIATPQLSLEAGTVRATLVLGPDCADVPREISRVELLSPQPDAQGKRPVVAVEYTQNTPLRVGVGTYVLRGVIGKAEAEMEVRVKTGEGLTPRLNMNAGILNLSRKGTTLDRMEVMPVPSAAGAKPNRIHTAYSETETLVLPAGTYRIHGFERGSSAPREKDVTLAPCQRIEVKF